MEGPLDTRLRTKKISKIFGGPQGGSPKMVILGHSPMEKPRIYLKLSPLLIGFISTLRWSGGQLGLNGVVIGGGTVDG